VQQYSTKKGAVQANKMFALRFFCVSIYIVKQQQGNSKMNAVTIVDGVYEGNTTSTFTLARGNERVSCTEVMYSAMQAFCLLALDLFLCYVEDDAEMLEATFEDWKEMAEDGVEGFKSWTV
jgi:hypothetical protein